MDARQARNPNRGFGARGRVLARFLDELRDRGAPPDPVWSEEGVIDLWASERIRRYFERGADDAGPCATLVAHGVALLDKCAVDRETLRDAQFGGGRRFFVAQAELMLDTAVGMALVREVQLTIHWLLREGNVFEAQNLSRFHHKLRNGVYETRKRIDEAERQRAEQLADRMTTLSVPRAEGASCSVANPAVAAPARALRPARGSPGARPRRQRRRPSSQRRRRAAAAAASRRAPPTSVRRPALAASLALSAAVWLVGVRLPAELREERPALALSDLGRTTEAVWFEDRWPSLYLAVDGPAWEQLTPEARLERVRAVANELTPQGYRGLDVRTAAGRPVARWLRRSGVMLLGRDEEVPETLATAASAAEGGS